MAPENERIAAVADDLERTMRRIGAWSDPPPPLRPFRQPFAMDTMPFEHWLQLVLLPRLRELARDGGPVPASSNLAGHAVREFDGRNDMGPLIDVLRRVDGLSAVTPRPSPPRLPTVSRITGVAGLAAVIGVLVGIQASDLASAWFSRWSPPQVSATYLGTVRPSDAFTPLRLHVIDSVRDDGTLDGGVGYVLLNGSAIPTPGRFVEVPDPLELDVTAPPDAGTVQRWLIAAGVAPSAPGLAPAADELLAIVAVAGATRTRDALADVASRLPAGLPEPQIIDIASHAPFWLELAVGITVPALLAAGVLAFAVAARRRA